MRKLLFYSLLILMFGIGATAKAEVLDKIEIPITGDNYDRPGRPKAPVLIPIICEYEGGTLYFGFNYDLGAVIVTVTNEGTNEQWQTVFQTSSGYNTMNISDDTGCYHIEIITIYNVVYQGDFNI